MDKKIDFYRVDSKSIIWKFKLLKIVYFYFLKKRRIYFKNRYFYGETDKNLSTDNDCT